MNQTEASSIITYLNRAGLVPAQEGQTAVWADALADVSYITAQQVVRDLAAGRMVTPRWVTTATIAEEAKRRRRIHTDRMGTPPEAPPSIDGDDIAGQIRWRKTVTRLIGDGLDKDAAVQAACRELKIPPPPAELESKPVAALVATIAKSTRPSRRVSSSQEEK